MSLSHLSHSGAKQVFLTRLDHHEGNVQTTERKNHIGETDKRDRDNHVEKSA
jgi:hypothetical protein